MMQGIIIRKAIFADPVPGKKPEIIGFVRQLLASDPRSLDNPIHRERWLELASDLGRAAADRDFDRMQNERGKTNPKKGPKV
jgi:hypothetical protein